MLRSLRYRTSEFWVFKRSLHYVHEMNARRADHICLSVRLIARFNSRTVGRIWMKFGMDVMPLKATLNSNFLFPAIGNTNMEDERTCDARSTLAPLLQGHIIMYGNRFWFFVYVANITYLETAVQIKIVFMTKSKAVSIRWTLATIQFRIFYFPITVVLYRCVSHFKIIK
jgi:hypothetical protein